MGPRGGTRLAPTFRPCSRGRLSDGVIFTLAILAVGSLLLAIAAFSSPPTEIVPEESAFRQSGRFAYDAGAPPTVYSGSSLTTGDPIYDALVPAHGRL